MTSLLLLLLLLLLLFNGMVGMVYGPDNNMSTDLSISSPQETQQQKSRYGSIDENHFGEINNNNAAIRQSSKQQVCSRGHWRAAEDAKLKELVSLYGPHNWNLISHKLQYNGRSGKSCRLRWYNQLDPRINRRAFSEEEEERLMSAHSLYGNKWAMLARLFPGRTDNAVKNHWHVLMARNYRRHHSSSTSSLLLTNTNTIITAAAAVEPSEPPPTLSNSDGGAPNNTPLWAPQTYLGLFPGPSTSEMMSVFKHANSYNYISATSAIIHQQAPPPPPCINNKNNNNFPNYYYYSEILTASSSPSRQQVSTADIVAGTAEERTAPPFIDFLGVGGTLLN